MLHSLLQSPRCIPLERNGCWSVETNVFDLIHDIVGLIMLAEACISPKKVELVWYRIFIIPIPQDLIVIFRFSLTQNVYVYRKMFEEYYSVFLMHCLIIMLSEPLLFWTNEQFSPDIMLNKSCCSLQYFVFQIDIHQQYVTITWQNQ